MVSLVLSILIALGTLSLWFMTLASDPSSAQASSDAARHILIVGLSVAALFQFCFWMGW
jgi:hypothetical protein